MFATLLNGKTKLQHGLLFRIIKRIGTVNAEK